MVTDSQTSAQDGAFSVCDHSSEKEEEENDEIHTGMLFSGCYPEEGRDPSHLLRLWRGGKGNSHVTEAAEDVNKLLTESESLK